MGNGRVLPATSIPANAFNFAVILLDKLDEHEGL